MHHDILYKINEFFSDTTIFNNCNKMILEFGFVKATMNIYTTSNSSSSKQIIKKHHSTMYVVYHHIYLGVLISNICTQCEVSALLHQVNVTIHLWTIDDISI